MLTADSEESGRLQLALSAIRTILNHVQGAVRECENRQKLADLQLRLDTRHIENTDPITGQYKVSLVHLTPSFIMVTEVISYVSHLYSTEV